MTNILASGSWDDGGTWDDGAAWLDDGSAAAPILATIEGIPDARMVKPSLTPALTSALASAPYASVYTGFMSPGTKADWGVDLTDELNGDTIDTIVSISTGAAAGLAGVTIDTGARRPAIDKANNLLRHCLSCSPPAGVSFLTAVPADVRYVVRTVGANAVPRTFEFTVVTKVVGL